VKATDPGTPVGDEADLGEQSLFSEEMRLNMNQHRPSWQDRGLHHLHPNIDAPNSRRSWRRSTFPPHAEGPGLHQAEQELLKIQKKIQTDINAKIEKNQREFFLRETAQGHP
jgi:ATP-dependent Lon protease